MSTLFSKYDVPAPRYTSYPTVPYWETPPSPSDWLEHLSYSLKNKEDSWSLYLHIPYCETLCTFCGCNTIITKDHSREKSYTEVLLKEWQFYLDHLPVLRMRELKHIHIGGGTPTFLSAENLIELLKPILDQVQKTKDFEASIEVDPRRTNNDQLKALYELGFNRISLGVQDFNPEVQRLVNRVQSYELTERITSEARAIGFKSVNFDLIYGLALQTSESIKETIQQTIRLRPDRIALYSFALVPWIKPAQRLFKDEDLPTGEAKRELYEISRTMLLDEGYIEVGMDHFALPEDSLSVAVREKKLHRNFMGYTNQKTNVLLGLGVSSISESLLSFHQNEKVLATYQQKIESVKLATHRGHQLTTEDQVRRAQILDFMTLGQVKLIEEQKQEVSVFLKEMLIDGLVELRDNLLIVTKKGKPFLRNACLFFDERLKRVKPTTQVFSQSL